MSMDSRTVRVARRVTGCHCLRRGGARCRNYRTGKPSRMSVDSNIIKCTNNSHEKGERLMTCDRHALNATRFESEVKNRDRLAALLT